MSPNILKVRGLSVAYGSRLVLDDISLALETAQVAALLGPNGAGKTTLLRALSGTLRPTRGTILIDDAPLDEFSRTALARSVAVVPGQLVTSFSIRVEELVALGRLPHEHPLLGPREADRAAIDAAMERVGIGHLRGRDVRELSLGERQLIVLAMAVAQQPRLLLLDEPTVHLDLRHQVSVLNLLRDLGREGMTILAVMHDIVLARQFFPRLMLLDSGRLEADGTPAEVLTKQRIRDVYGVDPALVGAVDR